MMKKLISILLGFGLLISGVIIFFTCKSAEDLGNLFGGKSGVGGYMLKIMYIYLGRIGTLVVNLFLVLGILLYAIKSKRTKNSL